MPKPEGKTVNGKKEGKWITWYANGNKRSEGGYKAGVKHGNWIQYYQDGTPKSEATFHEGLNVGKYVCYFDNGNKQWEGYYREHDGSSADGTKLGPWYCYCRDDGKTVWRTITYKKGGARAKPDDHLLGSCPKCEAPLQSMSTNCRCGAKVKKPKPVKVPPLEKAVNDYLKTLKK